MGCYYSRRASARDYTVYRKGKKKPFLSLVEKMGAFVIGFGNLCADIKRALQSR